MRIAVLDLGTNTFHLLISDAESDGSVKRVFKSKQVVKLGRGAIHKNYIAEKPFRRGIEALQHYADIIAEYRPDRVFAFATSAIRSAENGPQFVAEVLEKTGLSIRVISGDEEAELICLGVRQCVNLGTEPSLIMDIGGGSTEFIIANDERIFWKKSYNIGAARLLAQFAPSDPITGTEVVALETYFSSVLEDLAEQMEKHAPKRLIGSSGSFDTFAEMIGYRFHGRNVIKDKLSYRFDPEEYRQMHELLIASTAEERQEMKGLIKMRVDMIVLASICTNYILRTFAIPELELSKYALKEGALYRILQTV